MDEPKRLCYLDNNATTRVAPEVIEAMLPFFREHWGNPSSAYGFGHGVARDIEKARMQVAELINADLREIVFTSCGSEGNNTAIHSAITAQPEKRHIITTAVEHSATLNYCKFLQKKGYTVTYMPVEPDGSMDLHLLEKKIRPDTAVVSVMWANNETGVLFPIEEIAAICRSRHVLCHTDAVQVPGKLKIDVKTLGVDYLSLSAHKLHGPKGIGLLYVKKRTKFFPYIIGGHQEHGYRAGTENVPYIVGFGRAAELAMEHLPEENTRVRAMRDRLETTIFKTIPNTARNGAKEPRLPNTANISFANVEAEAILLLLDRLGICASSGSACTTGSIEPSHVLTAMDVKRPLAKGSIRFSLGRYNADGDIEYVVERLPGVIQRLRGTANAKTEVNGDIAKSRRAVSASA
jgi:cysteine desulfurase